MSKLAPGVDLELIDGWIQDRYTAILDELPWKRLEGETILQSPPSYATGTLAATQGSTAITGTGTTWTVGMNGRRIRIANAVESYVFTWVSATTGTLDRTYEQPDVTGATYRIDQALFSLPSTSRIVRAVRALHSPRPLEVVSPAELNRRFPGRPGYGAPRYIAHSWDTNTDPPVMQVELYPIPSSPDPLSQTLSFVVDHIYDPATFNPGVTNSTVLPWVRPAALIHGVMADVADWQEKYTAADLREKKFAAAVQQMKRINALQRGPQALRLAPELRGGSGAYPGYHRGKHADQDYFGPDDYDL